MKIGNVSRYPRVSIGEMSIESAIEQIISEGMARGEFDNLKGKGQPLDLDAYFNTPEDVRMGYSVLKANDFMPEEIGRLSEIAGLRKRLAGSTEAERGQIEKELREKELGLSLILERNKRRR